MIVKEGRKYVLYTQDKSKVLGKHYTYADAKKQEVAIKVSQALDKKKK